MIEAVVFIILLLIQVMLAIYSIISQRNLDRKYDYPLSGQVDAANALEKYSKIYRSVNLKVDSKIPEPAIALDDFILVNRDHVYKFDLYTNFFIIYQLELSKNDNRFARKLFIFQNFFFVIEIILFVLSLIVQNEIGTVMIAIAIGIQIGLLVISMIGFFIYDYILKVALEIAVDLLDMDEIEEARAEGLKTDLGLHVFEYPFRLVKNIVMFFVP